MEISVRDKDLYSFTRQHKNLMPTNITSEIAAAAMKLFRENYKWEKPIRSIGVRVSDLVLEDCPVQLDLFISQEQREKQHQVDVAVDTIRRRFGFYAIQRGLMYTDCKLAALNAKEGQCCPSPRLYGKRKQNRCICRIAVLENEV